MWIVTDNTIVHTPGPRIMRIHLVPNSTSAKFGEKTLQYSLSANLFN